MEAAAAGDCRDDGALPNLIAVDVVVVCAVEVIQPQQVVPPTARGPAQVPPPHPPPHDPDAPTPPSPAQSEAAVEPVPAARSGPEARTPASVAQRWHSAVNSGH